MQGRLGISDSLGRRSEGLMKSSDAWAPGKQILITFVLMMIIAKAEVAAAAAAVQLPLPNLPEKSFKIDFRIQCHDTPQVCVSSGVRNINDVDTHRPCWDFSYKKTCNYPLQYAQKDQCSNFLQCYIVADRECLLRDVLGMCVSQKREFSCKRQIDVMVPVEKLRTGLKEKAGLESLLCKGDIPCLDGNCVDKSYELNNEMMESVSKLYALSQAKSKGARDPKLFEGQSLHCTKKATEYSSCCKLGEGSGWGHNLGAHCSKSEQQLAEYRKRKRCVYVGKSGKGGISAKPVKHHYCCWDNMLNKVLQVEGRKQLGMNFGSGGNTDCRGLTIDELMRLDFTKMDFSEFVLEITKQMKIPNIGDVESRAKDSLSNIKEVDKAAPLSQQRKGGVNPAKERVMGNDAEYE